MIRTDSFLGQVIAHLARTHPFWTQQPTQQPDTSTDTDEENPPCP